jgi:hypothetical protein
MPSRCSRFALLATDERERCNSVAIWPADRVGHRLMSSRVSSTVQAFMSNLIVMKPPAYDYAICCGKNQPACTRAPSA